MTAVRLTGALAGAALWCAAAAGAQTCDGTRVLDCRIKGGKTLSVCIRGDKASYAFGPAGAPDLALTLPLSQVEATPWPGVGRSIWEEIVFPNNGVRYAVWVSTDRRPEGDGPTGGVVVSEGTRELASIACLDGTVNATVFGISDGFAAAGYCWNADGRFWSQDCPG